MLPIKMKNINVNLQINWEVKGGNLLHVLWDKSTKTGQL